ncbi:MAG: phosphoglycerate mutase family protein [Anaerolineae bacterium]|nr:phosphoglycerate mutase family protein [Anaerolineae bacterium]
MHLFLIRHGQSLLNLPDWQGGNRDVGLTEKGKEQAAALAHWLPSKVTTPKAIYCSSMQRAIETAMPLSETYQLPLLFEDRLREIGLNRLDHTPWPNEELPAYGSIWGSQIPFDSITPNVDEGESFMHFRTRVGSFVQDMVNLHREDSIIAVCHAGVVEAVLDHIYNTGPYRRCEAWTSNTGVTYIEYVAHAARETWRLRYHNRTNHLNF